MNNLTIASCHGSNAVEGGRLKGATDTDYFYFFCPKCPENHIMRVLDYGLRHDEPDNPYNSDLRPKASRSFIVAFKLHCQKCGLTDFVKVSNLGWQGGKHTDALRL